MLTYKLKIKNYSNKELIFKMQQDYSYAFRKLYSNFDQVNNKNFIKELCFKYSLDSWQFESLKTEVEFKIKKTDTLNKNNKKQQEEINEVLNRLKNKNNRKTKRTKFKLHNKLKRLSNFTDIVFGTKTLLRRLTFLSNDKEKNKKEIEKVRNEYQNNRLLPITIGGETYRHGNRKFDFELESNKIFFKTNREIKFEVEFICSEKQHNILLQLQALIDQNFILPVTIRLSTDYVWIMFNEEILNGFGLNEKEMKQELKKVSKECKELRKQIARSFYKEQESRKLIGKIKNRYLAIDLNPQYIGWSICDKINGKQKIIETGCYDLSKLSTKLKLSSDDPIQVYQNNKRKYEICNVIKDLFKKATHFRVAYFVMEELNFEDKTINKENKEFNRKVRNIWHRTLTCTLIDKYCNCLGIQKIEVNACYSSFIGNIQHEFFDPVNASLEICRRGIFKFEKGSFYPKITEADFDTMSKLINNQLRDVQNKTELLEKLKSLTNWRDLFNFFKSDGLKVKYRRSLDDLQNSFQRFSLFSLKSNIVFYSF
jgi:IS605 OrfB family transposase